MSLNKEEESKQLIRMLAKSAKEWTNKRRVRHTEMMRAEFQTAFEAGWNARGEINYDNRI